MLKTEGFTVAAARTLAVPRERLPNFVLLGPPKCGTSSLFSWLTAHPSVRGSLRKETFYLMDEGHPLRPAKCFDTDGWSGYAELFPPDAARVPVRMEATTHYLYQRTALEALSQLDDCRVCVVLREPAARVLSSFQYTQNNLARIAPSVTFDEYVDLVLAGRPISSICPNPTSAYVLSRDVWYGEYATHLAPWLDRFGRDRVTVLLFEELVADPRAGVQRLCRELGIDPAFYDPFDFGRKNQTYKIRFPALHRAAQRVRESIPLGAAQADRLRSHYTRLQGGRRAPERVDHSEALARLRARYAPHNVELSRLIGRELHGWRMRGPTTNGASATGVERRREASAAPLRILMIIPQAPQFRAMGGVSSAAALAIEAANAGAVVHVLTSHETPVTERLRESGLPVHVCDALDSGSDKGGSRLEKGARRLVRSVRVQRVITSLVREHRIDLLHANDRIAFWQSVIPGALLQRPVLDVVRDTQPNLGLRRWKWKAEFLLASRILVLSDEMAQSWCDVTTAPRSKFDVVYSIVDPARFRPMAAAQRAELRSRLGVAPEQELLLYAAAVRPKKQQLQFITECLPAVARARPCVTVAFVGDFDPEHDAYARTCRDAVTRLGLGAHVRFLGYRDDVADWYCAADLTVLASEKEGLARCMIESLASGTLVVSFDVASAREILERHACGVVVPQGAYGELAGAIADLLADRPRRAQMAEAGTRAASLLFAPSTVTTSYLDAARRLLHGAEPGRVEQAG